MVWVNIGIGLFLSAVYVATGMRIWQRRGKLWSLLGMTNALIYVWLTAHYIWDAYRGRLEPEPLNYVGISILILPALLVLQMVRWSLGDEAKAKYIVDHLEDGGK